MLKRLLISLLVIVPVLIIVKLIAFTIDKPVMSSPAYIEMVEEDFEAKRRFIDNESLFTIFEECKNKRESEALKFLYAYMPIGDIADYDPNLFLTGVRHAFKMRREMPWGKAIPEDVFRHFVLPVRINNETLDSSRVIFYKELKSRVNRLSLYEAVIEVNRWCQEKVVYTPSDERTSSPLATVKTAHGRCGEESVLTVAAMRSVGIPARQVYTPRWAHTDDNHAWVEVWVDGKWYYLGACEPEPKLNVAWFSSTAKRGLLMHSRVFGYYEGEEDIIKRTGAFTEINVTANYAPVSKVKVKVTDKAGNIVEGAGVDYKIYNYAELYSAIVTKTDRAGYSNATLGRGDVVVWAYKDDLFGYKKITPKDDSVEIEVVLDRREGDLFTAEMEIVPPVAGVAEQVVTKEEREENNRRLAIGDSLRSVYIKSFPDSVAITQFIRKLEESGKSTSKEPLERFIHSSRGNYMEIIRFLEWLPADSFQDGVDMLEMISEKDLRDTPAEVLKSHITYYGKLQNGQPGEFKKYLLNPRVGKELLCNWREYLSKELGEKGFENNPEAILNFCRNIKPASKYNPQNIPVTPVGVYKLMAADKKAAEALFIAICRTFGIPARFEEMTGKVQYWHNEEWIDVDLFGEERAVAREYGLLSVKYNGKIIDDPKFESHFTVAKIENGRINTLNFRDKEGYEGTNSVKSVFKEPVKVEQGYYLLTNGTRMASGKVLGRLSFFNIVKDKLTAAELIMRDDPEDLRVLANLNPEAKFFNGSIGKEQSILDCTGRGFFVLAFMKSNHEPSTHAIKDIQKYSDELERWGRPLIFLFNNNKQLQDIAGNRELSAGMSKSFVLGIDTDYQIFEEVTTSLKLGKNPEMPLILVADTFGRIVWYSQGYSIGLGERLYLVTGKL